MTPNWKETMAAHGKRYPLCAQCGIPTDGEFVRDGANYCKGHYVACECGAKRYEAAGLADCPVHSGPDSRVLSDGPYASGACCQGWTLCGLHDTECGNYGEGL